MIMYFGFFLKTFEMVMLVVNTSYIIGMLWLIMCEAIGDFYHDTEFREGQPFFESSEFFIPKFELNEMSAVKQAIAVTYFAQTSLSTVGFGDFYPVSDIERVVGAFILMFGVAIFSYIMGNFILIIEKFKGFNEDPEYLSDLFKFFGTIKKFNYNQALDIKLRTQIEEYFEFRWGQDKNKQFEKDSGQDIFE